MEVISENDKMLYANCMGFIKLRIRAIDEFLENARTTAFHQTNREFLYLQFRFIFEAISMSALCSHRHEYEKINSKYKKEWNAASIIKAVEKINPQFYPIPENVTPGFENAALSVTELIEYHGICGDNLHQYNPYKGFRYIEPSEEKNQFIRWRNKIILLLSSHYIMLANKKNVLLVILNTLPEGNVTVNEFDIVKIDPLPIASAS
jgi:hypothetical protein